MCSVAGWGHGASNAALCEANVTVSKQRDCLPIYLGLADHVLCAKSSSNGVPDKVGATGPRGGAALSAFCGAWRDALSRSSGCAAPKLGSAL